jgi:hypothetical protein
MSLLEQNYNDEAFYLKKSHKLLGIFDGKLKFMSISIVSYAKRYGSYDELKPAYDQWMKLVEDTNNAMP